MLNNDNNNDEIKKMVLFCIAAASCVLLVFLMVLVKLNDKPDEKKVEVSKEDVLENDDVAIGKSNMVSEDLDFWDMYEDEEKPARDKSDEEKKPAAETPKSSSTSMRNDFDDALSDKSMNNSEEPDDEDMDDGEHLRVVGDDGKPAFYKIIDDFPKHNFNFERFLQIENNRLKYTDTSARVKKGIDISKYQGTIDFSKIKNNDIDFIMVKVAGRGYETGDITIDDKFVEYIQGAEAAGIPAGVYFTSQAVNDVEAIEEANYAVAASLNYKVTYPVAIYLDSVQGENTRTGKLDNKDRTLIVEKFCETVKSYGRTPIICAPRDYLIAKLNLEELKDYDIWLRDDIGVSENLILDSVVMDENSQASSSTKASSSSSPSSSSSSERQSSSTKPASLGNGNDDGNNSVNGNSPLKGPDFPYRFIMWQYTENGGAMGINGKVNVNLCFEGYDER